MTDFFRNMIDDLKLENMAIAADGNLAADFSGYIDTGSYALNAVLSGSIYGGVPNNKITAFAGESTTGKTFFVLGIAKAFLDSDPKAGVVYFDTESAVTKEMMSSRGIDVNRVIVAEPATIQEFRTKALKIIEKYEQTPEDKRPPMMFVLDSLGMLSTTKEMEDSLEGKETRDMTKAQVIKAAFRVLTLKLAKVKIPMLVTNHVYAAVGSYFPTNEMAGGCLVPGTKIMTEDGLKNIEEIVEGDKVWTKEGVLKEVLQTHYFKSKPIYEIEFEDGYKVRCSDEHKFLVDGIWKEAKNLLLDDEVEVV